MVSIDLNLYFYLFVFFPNVSRFALCGWMQCDFEAVVEDLCSLRCHHRMPVRPKSDLFDLLSVCVSVRPFFYSPNVPVLFE